jgi:hypothetical protein
VSQKPQAVHLPLALVELMANRYAPRPLNQRLTRLRKHAFDQQHNRKSLTIELNVVSRWPILGAANAIRRNGPDADESSNKSDNI